MPLGDNPIAAGLGAMGDVLGAWGSGRTIEQYKSDRETVLNQRRKREQEEREERYISEILENAKNPDFDLRLDPTARKFAMENPQKFAEISQGYMLQKQGATQALAEGVDRLARIAQGGDASALIQGAYSLKQGANQAGLPTPQIDMAIEALQSGQKEGVEGAINAIFTARERFAKGGYYGEEPQRKLHSVKNGRATFINPDGTVSEEAVQGALPPPGEKMKVTDQRGVINDIEKLTREAVEVKGYASALSKLSENQSATDQLAAVFTFMKSLDPRSVVRDEEQKQVVGTGSVANAFKSYVNDIMGEGRLTPEVFADMVKTAKNLANQKISATSERAGVIIDAFGDSLDDKFKQRLIKIVPGKFEMLPDALDEIVAGTVDRPEIEVVETTEKPATLTTLKEAGIGTNVPAQMLKKTINWAEM